MALLDNIKKVLERKNLAYGYCVDPDGSTAFRTIFWNRKTISSPEVEGLTAPQTKPDKINRDIKQHGQEEQQGVERVHGPETILDYYRQNQMGGMSIQANALK